MIGVEMPFSFIFVSNSVSQSKKFREWKVYSEYECVNVVTRIFHTYIREVLVGIVRQDNFPVIMGKRHLEARMVCSRTHRRGF